MTPQNIRAGFKEMGMCPFNPLMINPTSLGPSAATDNLENKSVCMLMLFFMYTISIYFR